ncbi:hypothetical protein BC628DRAFT_1102817 [Trametes gibbosa]|nr:hypothetical protein BC628DRAFT_1102817 [Trametes gibbosa]
MDRLWTELPYWSNYSKFGSTNAMLVEYHHIAEYTRSASSESESFVVHSPYVGQADIFVHNVTKTSRSSLRGTYQYRAVRRVADALSVKLDKYDPRPAPPPARTGYTISETDGQPCTSPSGSAVNISPSPLRPLWSNVLISISFNVHLALLTVYGADD